LLTLINAVVIFCVQSSRNMLTMGKLMKISCENVFSPDLNVRVSGSVLSV